MSDERYLSVDDLLAEAEELTDHERVAELIREARQLETREK